MGTITFLGTGTSTGVPVAGCGCRVCRSSDPRDNRLRSSVWVRSGGMSVLIDTSTDLRTQALNYNIGSIDAVLYTHHHADHVHGVDELRVYNYYQRKAIPCYGNPKSLERIRALHGYIFDGKEAEGAAKPQLELVTVEGPFSIGGVDIIPLPVKHGTIDAYGYRIAKTAYITDCSLIPESTFPLLEDLDTLALGALWMDSHPTHFTIDRALEVIERVKPAKAFLTHLNHNRTHEEGQAVLPENVFLAWDGMALNL